MGFDKIYTLFIYNNRSSGFTLAELVVATTLIALVMASVYTALSTAVNTWHGGEPTNRTFEDARLTLGLLQKELQGALPAAGVLFNGGRDWVEFYTLTPPMYLEDGEGGRVLRVRYRLRTGEARKGRILEREEAVVESPLPMMPPTTDREEDMGIGRVRLGAPRRFDLARDVRDFHVRYLWVPPKLPREAHVPPPGLPPLIKDANPRGRGLPHALELTLEINDPTFPRGYVTFQTYVAFRASALDLPRDIFEEWAAVYLR